MKRARLAAVFVVVILGATALVAPRPRARTRTLPEPRTGGVMADEKKTGFAFRLSEGTEDATPAVPVRPAEARPLSEGETRAVLDRLPPFKTTDGDVQDFALRDKSLPAPRTGATVVGAFPPPETKEPPETSAAEPLQVLRHAPEGDVPLAANLNVTFSQPMVAVTSLDALAAADVPVKLAPQPPGRWRWVGTKTLLFEPEPRFPMATEYTVEVPAGTKSAVGGTLAQAVRWSFRTATPTLRTFWPDPHQGPARRDALMFAGFDQKIDPTAMLASVQVKAGAAAVRVRLATAEEVEADENVRARAKAAESGRWLAFRSEEPLPAETRVGVSIAAGASSAEGPLRTRTAQEQAFTTYGRMRVTDHGCGWDKKCPPFTPWRIVFSNPIDATRFSKEMVTVEPPLRGLKAQVYGQTLMVQGASKGRTSYRVSLARTLPDTFDQTLDTPETLTFDVTDAEPALVSQAGEMTVLDPTGPPRFSVVTVNQPSVKVRAYAVTPADWPAFRAYMQKFQRDQDDSLVPPGRLAFSSDVPVAGERDEPVETRIDLAPALQDGLGQLVLVVEPKVQPKERWARRSVRTWVQATQIGLTAFGDATDLVAWASSLKSGAPLAGVSLELAPDGIKGESDATGLSTLALGAGAAVLVARSGRDVAILPESQYIWQQGTSWQQRREPDGLRWFVFDDRRLYRPGEEVRVKGWIRRVGAGETGDVAALSGAEKGLTYTVVDSRGNEVLKGTGELNAFGAFDLALPLPPTMNLGDAVLNVTAKAPGLVGPTYAHAFQVQEFRRPEFEVTAAASEAPHFVGGHAVTTVTAAYYAGGALPNAEVAWNVTATPAQFTPPNRDDFTFGFWVPWWETGVRGDGAGEGPKVQTFSARTDASGHHRLRIDFDGAEPPRATTVHAEATVTDVNRQAWTASADLLVHAADVYVGLRSDRVFVQQGEPIRLEAIAVDLDGAAVPGRPIAIHAERLDWEQEGGEWTEKAVDPQDCAVASASDAVRCTFATKEGGVYRVTATVTDAQGRRNQTRIQRWVAGGKTPPSRAVAQEKVTLIPSRKDWKAGDTAEILVLAPFAPAEGVLTLRRSGILRTERFAMKGASHTLKIPLEEAWTPNVVVQVDLVGAAPRVDDTGARAPKLPPRPAYASGELNLAIPPLARTLGVSVAPREKELAPGEGTTLDVAVTDAAGKAVTDSELAVVVVDEAVLALTGYRIPDPIEVFYAPRAAGVTDRHLRQHVLLAKPQELPEGAPEPQVLADELAMNGRVAEGGVARGFLAFSASAAPAAPPVAKPMARMRLDESKKTLHAGEDAAASPIRMRTDFRALALFMASVTTDAQGHAHVPVTLPDSLSRYRVTAVAVTAGNRFGKGESTVTVRLPLMVRPSAPRFLNFGDRIELPVVLQNQTDKPFDADVAMRAANADLTAGGGRRVTIPAHDRVEVRFPVAAARAGTARFQVGAVAGHATDAAEIQLPVWTPATTEAFATYGQIDKGAIVQPVQAPSGVVPQFGGLEVTTSSTALQSLTDAVLYLTAYPFECAEQVSSRVIAIAALKDVLAAFQAEGLPKPEEMVAAVDRDVKRLRQMQNADGGFAFWYRGDESWPYVSVHVAHALQRAKEKGFDVPADTLERSEGYLRDIERHVAEKKYGPLTRRTLVAYALYVRSRMGDRDVAHAQALLHEEGPKELSFEALGWLLSVLSGDPGSAADVTTLRTYLANHATEEAATAHFAVAYGDSAHLILYSDRRADAVVLEALIGDQPNNDLIPKLVEGLLGHRVRGRWENTQENAFVLLALDRYFRTYEKVTPDFVARTWLGDAYAGDHAFRGHTTERHHVDIPMKYLAGGKATKDLVLAKDGAGRLYYRIGLQYAPASLTLAASDHGFTVQRAYEGVDRKEDVTRGADGTWHVKAGARVRVTLTMVAPSRRYHVALVDPLPAGLEAQNAALATTGTLPPSGRDETVSVMGAPGLGGSTQMGHWWWWTRVWYEHQNLRDDRVEAFASLLWEGVYSYSYVARATTAGSFVVPPTKAEEMYHPETFGRAATDRLVVE
jgi:uncharacterized protein YfaS (alpha-2-macroglobulin family)